MVGGALAARAEVAVGVLARAPVFAVVAVERLPDGAQGFEERREQTPALRQDVLDVRGAAAEVASLDEFVAQHVAQAVCERATAYRVQAREQLGRAPRAAREVAHNQKRPLVAHDLQSAPHGAAVTFTSSHRKAVLPRLLFSARRSLTQRLDFALQRNRHACGAEK